MLQIILLYLISIQVQILGGNQSSSIRYARPQLYVHGRSSITILAIFNFTRRRAGLADITTLSTQANFGLLLEKERWAEFAWEGLYWYDLVRTERALPIMNTWMQTNYQKTITQNNFVYPLPKAELLVNLGQYEQNSGYK